MFAVVALAAFAAAKVNMPMSMAGVGYSSDTQQVTHEMCFRSNVSAMTGAESHIQLQRALSFEDLQTSIKRNVAAGAQVGVFDLGAEATYLRTVQDTQYSQSLNYYQYSSATANLQLGGTGLNALTPFGQAMYANGTDQHFGVVCGDSYLTSYQAGAVLLLGINVVLSNKEQQAKFATAISVGVEDIVSATLTIQTISQELTLTGRVELGAYQLGGNPNELTQILSKDASGDYYVLSCALDDMANCHTAANGLLIYATTQFPAQYSFTTGEGLAFLGDGFYTYSPIDYIALKTPKTYVTSAVTTARENLAGALREAEYYLQSFYPLYQWYPVAWDQSSALYADVKAGYTAAADNIATVLNYVNPEQGAKGCFDLPDGCVALSQTILAALTDLAAFLPALEAVKLLLPIGPATGNSVAAYVWNGSGYGVMTLPVPPSRDTFHGMLASQRNATALSYEMKYRNHKNEARYARFDGTATAAGANYTGRVCVGDKTSKLDSCSDMTVTSTPSPYYFTAYPN